MTPETDELNWWSEPLIWAASDCEMKKVLDEALALLAFNPTILNGIEADQDTVAKAKKKVRQADQRWQAAQTQPLPGLCVAEAPECETDRLTLLQGRPRMEPEVVYVFMVLRGYLGSICDREARDRLMDSTTVQMYLRSRGEFFPGWTTILENINAVSNATRSHILDAQLAMIVDEGLDDFSQAILDSTAVEANSAWPTDARILLGLLERAFASSQKLERFGLSNVPSWWVPHCRDPDIPREHGHGIRIYECGTAAVARHCLATFSERESVPMRAERRPLATRITALSPEPCIEGGRPVLLAHQVHVDGQLGLSVRRTDEG